MKYGLQLYSIRDITQNDLASAIKKTAELGYNCVEFAGFFGHTANEINSMLENSGLEISGTHSSFDDLVNNYEETVAYHKAIGNRHYIIPGYDISDQSKLDYFISVSAKYPVIATTSKLLSTGADCKMVKLIVIDEMIGSMTEFKQIIGADIDNEAVKYARNRFSDKKVDLLVLNSLEKIARNEYNISDSDELFIIGNPPYNDRTSIVQNYLKTYNIYNINEKVEHRDLGISFLLSYNELKADYICVLHPLSYLIKKTNFNSLGRFKDNYVLEDALIISSQIFCSTSLSFFPIIIGLYKRSEKGMDYEYIKNYKFKTIENHKFSLNDFDFISKYVDKYPNKNKIHKSNVVAKFYTMRDINALKRSRTFIQEDCSNTVYITDNKYSLYCYIDVFKKYIDKLPYYFGNLDVFINYQKFKSIENEFVELSENNIKSNNIDKYFLELFGEIS